MPKSEKSRSGQIDIGSERERCARIAESEPEPNGEMPPELYGGEWRYMAAKMAVAVMLDEATVEIKRLRAALEAIASMTDEEIGVRFRISGHKTEAQIAGKSVIYSILSSCRNMARAGLELPAPPPQHQEIDDA